MTPLPPAEALSAAEGEESRFLPGCRAPEARCHRHSAAPLVRLRMQISRERLGEGSATPQEYPHAHFLCHPERSRGTPGSLVCPSFL